MDFGDGFRVSVVVVVVDVDLVVVLIGIDIVVVSVSISYWNCVDDRMGEFNMGTMAGRMGARIVDDNTWYGRSVIKSKS